MQNEVKVSQEDLGWATSAAQHLCSTQDRDAAIRLLAQAFARHRHQAERETLARMEPVAWLHTLHLEHGQSLTKLTDWDCIDPDEPEWTAFGRPGRDYSEEYQVTSQPLYALPPAPEAV